MNAPSESLSWGNEVSRGALKLFYEPAEDDPKHDDHYAEHYLNIDLATKLIQFHEKDPEYRPAVIHALTTTNG
jgi:hypothetical protein